ncbi:hypothetical protein KIW84_054611 [Lathyrus oleraceus]|uniref:Uncharacterized protein n=1 Tax=Pisum sativum TaxID=3888 RepID=A0A9D5AHN6_PEA|nr:hypothetical protein KIW84_054611 [Pisum sativum]
MAADRRKTRTEDVWWHVEGVVAHCNPIVAFGKAVVIKYSGVSPHVKIERKALDVIFVIECNSGMPIFCAKTFTMRSLSIDAYYTIPHSQAAAYQYRTAVGAIRPTLLLRELVGSATDNHMLAFLMRRLMNRLGGVSWHGGMVASVQTFFRQSQERGSRLKVYPSFHRGRPLPCK